MSQFTEVSYEQGSDMIESSKVLKYLDLGSVAIYEVDHGAHGMMMVVTSALDNKACVASV